MNRRDALKLASSALLTSGLSACCDIIPSVATPVFYGYQYFGTDQGAPLAMNVFYPSKDGSPQNATFYQGCGDYPLILFIHGNGTSYRSWIDLPATLARAGFIVSVPDVDPNLPSQIDVSLFKVFSFIHLNSPFAKYLSPTFGLCGHSYGGAAALQVAANFGASAFAGLSGAYSGWPGFTAGPIFSQLSCPSLIVWGTAELEDAGGAFNTFDLSRTSDLKLWDTINRPKHLLTVNKGHHFDYVPPGSTDLNPGLIPRGPCLKTPLITTDFVVSFFSKYIGRAKTNTAQAIPDNLIPPAFPLTFKQAFYDGSFLSAFSNFKFNQSQQEGSSCWFTQHWETNSASQAMGDLSMG